MIAENINFLEQLRAGIPHTMVHSDFAAFLQEQIMVNKKLQLEIDSLKLRLAKLEDGND